MPFPCVGSHSSRSSAARRDRRGPLRGGRFQHGRNGAGAGQALKWVARHPAQTRKRHHRGAELRRLLRPGAKRPYKLSPFGLSTSSLGGLKRGPYCFSNLRTARRTLVPSVDEDKYRRDGAKPQPRIGRTALAHVGATCPRRAGPPDRRSPGALLELLDVVRLDFFARRFLGKSSASRATAVSLAGPSLRSPCRSCGERCFFLDHIFQQLLLAG